MPDQRLQLVLVHVSKVTTNDRVHQRVVRQSASPLLSVHRLNGTEDLTKMASRRLPVYWLSLGLLRLAQWSTERAHRRTRVRLLRQDRELDDLLAFAGNNE